MYDTSQVPVCESVSFALACVAMLSYLHFVCLGFASSFEIISCYGFGFANGALGIVWVPVSKIPSSLQISLCFISLRCLLLLRRLLLTPAVYFNSIPIYHTSHYPSSPSGKLIGPCPCQFHTVPRHCNSFIVLGVTESTKRNFTLSFGSMFFRASGDVLLWMCSFFEPLTLIDGSLYASSWVAI